MIEALAVFYLGFFVLNWVLGLNVDFGKGGGVGLEVPERRRGLSLGFRARN